MSVRPVEPNQSLITMIERLLEDAKSGSLQSFVGAGFMINGDRLAFWSDTHPNVWEQLGSLEAMKLEYVRRHPEIITG